MTTAVRRSSVFLLIGIAFFVMMSKRLGAPPKATKFINQQNDTAVETAKLAAEYEELLRKAEADKSEANNKVQRATIDLHETARKLERVGPLVVGGG
jgi:hypothetical protein